MTDMPALIPLTSPIEETVATEVLLLLQIPPPVVLLSAVVVLTHRPVAPVMADGEGFTDTVVAVLHPVDKV